MMSELDRSSVDDTVDDTDPFGSSVTPEAAASLQVPDLATHTSTTPTHSHRQDKHNLDPARFLLELLKFCFHTSSRWHNLAQARFHYTHYRYWDLGQARFHYTHYRYWDLGQARFHYTHNRYLDLAQARSCFGGVWCASGDLYNGGQFSRSHQLNFSRLIHAHKSLYPHATATVPYLCKHLYHPPPPPPPPIKNWLEGLLHCLLSSSLMVCSEDMSAIRGQLGLPVSSCIFIF